MIKKIELNAAQRLQQFVGAMATLRGTRTGLGNILVWISKRYPQHSCRVKVSNIRDSYSPDDNFSIDLAGIVQEGDEKMTSAEMARIRKWIEINRDVIARFWNDDQYLDDEMKKDLKKVPKKI